MDVKKFIGELLSSLNNIDIVEDIDLKADGVILSGRIFLKQKKFLEVYFNEITGTIAFALIKKGKRVWGIDRDNIRDWHIHPVNDP